MLCAGAGALHTGEADAELKGRCGGSDVSQPAASPPSLPRGAHPDSGPGTIFGEKTPKSGD